MTKQEKREMVIEGLKMSYTYSNVDEENTLVPQQLVLDALALLKAQVPRVMTLEEALNSLVIEYRSGKLQEVGKLVFTEGFEYYGVLWRVWDNMPTDEQREKEPWDDAER